MVQSVVELIRMDTLRVVVVSVLIIIFTFIAVRSELKNWRIGKTLKFFRELKHEQRQLLHVLSGNKDRQYKQIACSNYLDEQEKILTLMVIGKLEYSLFNDLIKPLVIESINFKIMSSYVEEIKEANLDRDPSEILYPHMFQLIEDYNDDRVDISKV